jgi:hypothetical protein
MIIPAHLPIMPAASDSAPRRLGCVRAKSAASRAEGLADVDVLVMLVGHW